MQPRPAKTIPGWAAIALVTILAYGLLACSQVNSLQFNAVPLSEVRGNGQLARFDTLDGKRFEMTVESVNFPYVVGVDRGQRVQLDLRQVKGVAIASQQPDQAATSIKNMTIVAGTYGAVLIGIALIILATKSSCPFFYVEEEVGSRWWARPTAAPPSVRSPATISCRRRFRRAPTSMPVCRTRRTKPSSPTRWSWSSSIIGPTSGCSRRSTRAPSRSARPDRPRRRAIKTAATSVGWSAPLTTKSGRPIWRRWPCGPHRHSGESLSLTFQPTADVPWRVGGIPVLELSAGNTPWIDAVMGRFFALMGSRLEGYIEDGNALDARAKIAAWREREGVDLLVEAELDGKFQPVALVPTVGPMSLRRVAIPLPAVAASSGRPLHVRVSGGLGFWRVDEAALSWQTELDEKPRHIAPTGARDPAGRDWREALRAVDGTSHVLADRGDRLDSSFDLPPVATGRTRSAFLFTHGYYNVHRPPNGDWSPLVLRDLRDRPGALAAFGLDLFRGYMRLVAGAPAR